MKAYSHTLATVARYKKLGNSGLFKNGKKMLAVLLPATRTSCFQGTFSDKLSNDSFISILLSHLNLSFDFKQYQAFKKRRERLLHWHLERRNIKRPAGHFCRHNTRPWRNKYSSNNILDCYLPHVQMSNLNSKHIQENNLLTSPWTSWNEE